MERRQPRPIEPDVGKALKEANPHIFGGPLSPLPKDRGEIKRRYDEFRQDIGLET